MRKIFILLIAALMVCFGSVSARAFIIDLKFSGTITYLSPYDSNPNINLGDDFTGSFYWNSETNPSPSLGDGDFGGGGPSYGTRYQYSSYPYQQGDWSIQLNQYSFHGRPGGISVQDGTDDRLHFLTEAPGAISPSPDYGEFIDIMWFTFIDTSGTVYDDESLPTTFDVAHFDRIEFGIQDFYTESGGLPPEFAAMNITGTIDQISAAPVPEPGTIFLLGLGGLLGTVIMRKHVKG